MRVGVIGPIGPDLFADNIADCLPDVGAEAVRLGTHRVTATGRAGNALTKLADATPSLDAVLQRKLTKRAIEAECDLVISVIGSLLPKTVERLRQNGTKVVLWFPDAVTSLARQRMFEADYDRLYFKDPEFVAGLEHRLGAAVGYLPEACNPRWHRPIGEPGSTPGVVVAGNYYPSRVALLDRLETDKVPMRLYGSEFAPWITQRPVMSSHTHQVIFCAEKAEVFRRASAVLNNLHPAENGMNCRLFEAAGSGAAILCEDRPVLRDLFDVGSEVLAFRNYDQLLTQCRRLLEDPSLSGRIGDAAAKRAHAEHTYQHRLVDILTATS